MRIIKPSYFDSFRCIAAACPDSCCKEWDVQVDAASAAYYRSLTGELGDKLRQVLKDEDGETYMTIENRRCPMWRADGLCRSGGAVCLYGWFDRTAFASWWAAVFWKKLFAPL